MMPVQVSGHNLLLTVGFGGAGKSALGREMCRQLCERGVPAVAISYGYIMRALAVLAKAMNSNPRRFLHPVNIVKEARERLILVDGWPVLDNRAISRDELKQLNIETCASQLGQDHAIQQFALSLIVAIIAEHERNGGVVFLDGRPELLDRFPTACFKGWLSVSDEVGAIRGQRDVATLRARNRSDSLLGGVGVLERPPAGVFTLNTDDLLIDQMVALCRGPMLMAAGLGHLLEED